MKKHKNKLIIFGVIVLLGIVGNLMNSNSSSKCQVCKDTITSTEMCFSSRGRQFKSSQLGGGIKYCSVSCLRKVGLTPQY